MEVSGVSLMRIKILARDSPLSIPFSIPKHRNPPKLKCVLSSANTAAAQRLCTPPPCIPPPMVTVSAATLRAFALVTAVKLLLVPCYYSTDFEVHRNWLAVTGTRPLREWYVDTTSQWTLDYPPLFAYFESALAVVANVVDPKMLAVRATPYASSACVLFQRISVIAGDVFLAIGTWFAATTPTRTKKKNSKTFAVASATLLVLFSPGLLLVDHVHFQYNGLGLGILVLAIGFAGRGDALFAAFFFSVAVHFKHVFLYAAPAFATHLLARHVPGGWRMGWRTDRVLLVKITRRIASYVSVAAFVTAVSLGPFIANGQLLVVTNRLFPFERGLTHAFWACNFWALYNAGDKILVKALRFSGAVSQNAVVPTANFAGGMAGAGGSFLQTHLALPAVTPSMANVLVLLSSLPALYAHAVRKSPDEARKQTKQTLNPSALPKLVAHCNSCAFYFGWHVHEKAILTVLVPFGLAVALDADDERIDAGDFAKVAGQFLFLSVVGTYALMPLLFEPWEWLLKHFILLLWVVCVVGLVRQVIETKRAPGEDSRHPLFTQTQFLFLTTCLPVVELYRTFGHFLVFGPEKMQFLPLALVSATCAAGVTHALGAQTYANVKNILVRQGKTY